MYGPCQALGHQPCNPGLITTALRCLHQACFHRKGQTAEANKHLAWPLSATAPSEMGEALPRSELVALSLHSRATHSQSSLA